jgi:hypothetical protein
MLKNYKGEIINILNVLWVEIIVLGKLDCGSLFFGVKAFCKNGAMSEIIAISYDYDELAIIKCNTEILIKDAKQKTPDT